MISKLLLITTLGLLLTACGDSKHSAYYQDDRPPTDHVDVTHLVDAVPKVEPITRAGNKNPYTVLGSTYRILPTSLGYQKTGVASWYGSKFHGRPTANGETYDMYAMSAAHKTLPIPCYVRVQNLDNGQSVIVRVNDRGPFLHDRIIDLSFAAAKKLGYSDKGTANVQVTALDPRDYQRQDHVSQSAIENQPAQAVSFLQIGAFNSAQSAAALQTRIQNRINTEVPVIVRPTGREAKTIFKVLVGPIAGAAEVVKWRNWLQQEENLIPFLVHN